MTFHETPPRTDDLDLGPTGTDALEYRIDKLLRENQALAERLVRLMRIEEAAKAVVESQDAIESHCGDLINEVTEQDDREELSTLRIMAIEDLREALTEQSSALRDIVRFAIKLAMGPDPHSGGDPHPDTIDAITDGVLARIAVSNARLAKYADEPWREQDQFYHVDHAMGHIRESANSIGVQTDLPWPSEWLSDLGQPEAAHAGLRIDFLLFRHAKDEKK